MKSISVVSRTVIIAGVVATMFLLVRSRMTFDDVTMLYRASKYRLGYSRDNGFEHHITHQS
jgi:hypothetical protein